MKNFVKLTVALVALTVILAAGVSAVIGVMALAGCNITNGELSTIQTVWVMVGLSASTLASMTALVAVIMLLACLLAEVCKNTPLEKGMDAVAHYCAESLRAFPECLEFVQML